MRRTAGRPAVSPPGGAPTTRVRVDRVALGALGVGALGVVVLVSAVLAVLGWRATVVTSGSMAPRVQVGDLVVVRPVGVSDLVPGQVLLVDDPDSPGSLRLHRLAAVTDGGLQLRGDANPTPDSSLVGPAAVHGIGTVRLPGVGLPVLWASGRPWLPATAAGLGLASLAGLAVLRRPARTPRHAAPVTASRAVPVTGLRVTAVLTVAVLLPGTATAAFSATTSNGPVSLSSAVYYTCASAAVNAAQYADLQEANGPDARIVGTYPATGTYIGGVSYRVPGPVCNSASGAVRLDGTGMVQSPVNRILAANQAFSLQLWFRTTTTTGGYLVGFGNGADGAASTVLDRLVWMNDAGQLVFGVNNGSYQTTTTSASYRDGTWHMLTATFEAGTAAGSGLRIFVDGNLAAENPGANLSQQYGGYFRAGYDDLTNWPGRPTTHHFTGSIAHMTIFASRLRRDDVTDQFRAAN